MDKKDIVRLLIKYQTGDCTEQEIALVEQWYFQFNEEPVETSYEKMSEIGREITDHLPGKKTRNFRIRQMLAASAIITIAISLIIEMIFHKRAPIVYHQQLEIVAGGNKAMLTLANGTRIDLAGAPNGQLIVRQGLSVQKNAAGRIIYGSNQAKHQKAETPNDNITTPPGGFWQVRLQDGTEVWLNNSSSLTYPSSFAQKKERRVILQGQAYFEVAKDSLHPFIVISGHQEVRVLGTHFDINAFPEENVFATTLLEGRVKVSNTINRQTTQLVPGQQSLLTENGVTVTEVNTEQAIAWKNGYFRFNNTPVKQVMQELARWYDIDVNFEGPVSGERLTGRISRSKNISKVLTALEATRTIHFKVEGRRITVMK